MDSATPDSSRPVEPGEQPATIFIIARQDIYVDGLTRILTELPGIDIVARSGPESDCVEHYAAHPADILMIEQSALLELAGAQPADAVFEPFAQLNPELRIVVLGHGMDDIFIRRMLNAGAHGFIDSRTGPQLLGTAIAEVHAGGYWLGRDALRYLVRSVSEMDHLVEQSIADKIEHMKDRLTQRETDVLQRVLEGMSTREIAADLGLSEQSIKLHLGHLFRKFEVNNRSQLILMAFKRVCPVNNMIQLFRRALDRRNIACGRPPVIKDPLEGMP